MFDLISSLSLASMKLVHWFGALRVVTPVILIVAVLLSLDTVPSPFVTAPLSILPTVNPYCVALSFVTPPGPRKYKSLTVVSSLPVNVRSVFSPV